MNTMGNKTHDSSHLTKPTQRETTTHTKHFGGARNDVDKQHYYNPSDITRNTNRQNNTHTKHFSSARNDVNKQQYYNSLDIPNITKKQQTMYNINNNIGGGGIQNKTSNSACDYADLP